MLPQTTSVAAVEVHISAGTGHAIEITGTAGDVTLDNVLFTGYAGTNGSTGNEAIYVNIGSGTVNITIAGGGDTPTIRTAGATVNVINNITLTVTGLITGSDVVIYEAGTTNVLDSVDANAGTTWDYGYSAPDTIDIGVFLVGYIPFYIRNLAIGASDSSVPVAQVVDRAYLL